jgi:hypothetical protein
LKAGGKSGTDMMNTASRLFAVGLLAAVPVIAGLIGKVFVCAAGDEVPTLVLLRAEAITSRMFATAGVAVEWRYKGSAAVSTDFVGALAYAQPYQDSKIVVMLDRVERSARQSSQVSNVLAHVMTHQITHLLQGVSRHFRSRRDEGPLEGAGL